MKKIIILQLLFMGIFGWSQAKAKKTFEINTNYNTKTNAIYLRLKDVFDDSRCPENTQCIWAGEVSVCIEVFKNRQLIEEKILIINAQNQAENCRWFEQFNVLKKNKKIRSFAVSPIPKATENQTERPAKKVVLTFE